MNVTPAAASLRSRSVFICCQAGEAAQMRPPLYRPGQMSMLPSCLRR